MKQRRIAIPHEHGGWAMVAVPYAFGMAAGTPQWLHAPLFLAWLLLYLSSYPFLQAVKRPADRRYWAGWSLAYGAAALACLLPPLVAEPRLLYFGPLLLALLAVNIWHARRRTERAAINDLCALLSFSVGGAAAYLLGGGGWDMTMAAVVLFSFLHFAGSMFFVKSVFRERANKRWVMYARVYHGLLPFIPLAVGYAWLALPYLFSTARAFAYAGRQLRPMRVGMIEIAGALQFALLSAWLIHLHP